MSVFKNVNLAYVYVENWEAAKKFYREIIGWPVALSDDSDGWEEYGKDGETHIAIDRWDDGDRMPVSKGTTIVLTVDDAYEVTNSLRSKGVRCDEVVEIPGEIALGTFYDPEGNRWQFASSNG